MADPLKWSLIGLHDQMNKMIRREAIFFLILFNYKK